MTSISLKSLQRITVIMHKLAMQEPDVLEALTLLNLEGVVQRLVNCALMEKRKRMEAA